MFDVATVGCFPASCLNIRYLRQVFNSSCINYIQFFVFGELGFLCVVLKEALSLTAEFRPETTHYISIR